jgi:hypothetical protein
MLERPLRAANARAAARWTAAAAFVLAADLIAAARGRAAGDA